MGEQCADCGCDLDGEYWEFQNPYTLGVMYFCSEECHENLLLRKADDDIDDYEQEIADGDR